MGNKDSLNEKKYNDALNWNKLKVENPMQSQPV